ncbi:MAG: Cof-type HAD-IIB family hydrolase [Enterobacteriaceae bacterium]
MFKIIVSDLDGTLLSPEHKLTKYTKSVFRSLFLKKILLILATGRHHLDVIKICKNLSIKSYMITSNGAIILNPEKKIIFSKNLNKNIAKNLISIAYEDINIFTNVFRHNSWFTNRNKIDYKNFFYESNFSNKIFEKENFSTEGIYKVYFTSNYHEKLMVLYNKLIDRWGNKINASFSSLLCLEVTDGKISKGNALKKVVKLLGYKLKDCISFGDGMNDKEMLQISGKGCIMKNASNLLKECLPKLEIIGSNKNDAVAKYLDNLYL